MRLAGLRWSTAAGCVVGLMTTFPAEARAQGVDPADRAVVKMGPLAWTPSLSIPSIGVDTNVFNEAIAPRRDFTANVQPAVDGWLRLGRARFTVREQLNLMYFRRYASERAVNNSTTVTGRLDLVWGSPHASVGFVHTKDRADARIDTRATIKTRPVAAGVDFHLGGSLDIDLEGTANRVSFDDGSTFGGTSLASALDRSNRAYRGTLRYAITPPTTLSLRVVRQEEEFASNASQNNVSVRVMPGVTLSTDALITGDLHVGWLSFQPNRPAIPDSNVLVATGDLAYVLLGVTRFQLTVNRDVVPSIDSGSSYALQTSYTGTITHRVSDRWDVSATGSHLRLDFGQVATQVGDQGKASRADTVRTYGAGIGVYFSRGLRLGVRAESMTRKSALPLGNYDNLRVMCSVSYTRQ